MIRKLYLGLGLAALAVGFAGMFLPLVPTTPLALLAAYFFSRSSPSIHRWLRDHRRFGPILQDWENGQAIRPRAKAASVVLMFGLVAYSVWFVVRSPYLQVLLIAISLGVALFVLSRPSAPPAPGPR